MIRKGELVYLAAPYRHEDPQVEDNRLDQMISADAKLMAAGVHTITGLDKSILYTTIDMPVDFDWHEYCKNLISRCDCVLVLLLDGWQESKGVQTEMLYAIGYGKRILVADPDGSNIRLLAEMLR